MVYRKILLSVLLLFLSCTSFAFAADVASCATLKGVKIDFSNPFKLEFIVDSGHTGKLDPVQAKLLVNYFLAALAMPEEKLWVNLSPYEPDRVIEPDLSQTEFGEGLLSQDCALKRFAASLTNPGTESGKRYWDKINNVGANNHSPVHQNFNKVWIVPRSAKIYQNEDTALIESRGLKVMTEEDYVAAQKNSERPPTPPLAKRGSDQGTAFKTIILPLIEQEVNSGERFVQLRQMYDAFILASWFKKKLQDSLFRHYLDQEKVSGIDLADKTAKEKIYQQYAQSFSGGEYNIVKKDYNRYSGKATRRKYVSGGIIFTGVTGHFVDTALAVRSLPANQNIHPDLEVILAPVNSEPEFILNERGTLTSSHHDVDAAIVQGLGDEIRGLSVKEIRARYRDENGIIVLPVNELLRKTGLVAHIGLGDYYGEPVIYVDDIFTMMGQKKALAKIEGHARYVIAGWETKRKELKLDYQGMRLWIQENSNREGTGLAQQLARRLNDEAASRENSSIVGVTDYDQSSFAYRRQAGGRVDRCLAAILSVMRRNAPAVKGILDVEELTESVTMMLTWQTTMPLASTDPHGNIAIRYELLDELSDEELMWVIAHELGHVQIERQMKKDGRLPASERLQRLLVTEKDEKSDGLTLADVDSEYRRQLEKDSQEEELLADKIGIFLALKAGCRPGVGKSELLKLKALRQKLQALGKDKYREISGLENVKTHPDNDLRIAKMRQWQDEFGIEYPGTIYEEDVVLAVQPKVGQGEAEERDLGGVDFGYHASHVITLKGKLRDKDFPIIAIGLKNSRGLRIKELSTELH